jgi:hypothetical protein
MVSPDSRDIACPLAGRNSTHRPVQISGTGSDFASFYKLLDALVMTSTILMVGVGLDDPDFQLLFEDNRARFEHALPHYMTYGGDPNADLALTVRETLGIKL